MAGSDSLLLKYTKFRFFVVFCYLSGVFSAISSIGLVISVWCAFLLHLGMVECDGRRSLWSPTYMSDSYCYCYNYDMKLFSDDHFSF